MVGAGIGAYRMSITPLHLQGRVSSAAQFLTMLGIPLAPLLGGGLLQAFSGPVATLVLAGLGLISALVLTQSAAVRGIPRPARWPRLDDENVPTGQAPTHA